MSHPTPATKSRQSRKETRQSRKDFPLTQRTDGRWQKKHAGRTYYFRGTKKEALAEWLRVKDDIYGGHDPRQKSGELTVKDLVNLFLEAKETRVQQGELSRRSWNDYKKSCQTIVDAFGRTKLVEELDSRDFETLRNSLARGRSLTTLKNEITRIRVVFSWATKQDYVTKVRGLASFEKPSKRAMRKEEESRPSRMFAPEEIRRLVDNASPQVKAFVLLGINCGMGNTDIAHLDEKHVDGEWMTYPRPKTGVPRRAKLWSETTAAIEAAGGLPFRTKYGRRWVSSSSSDNAISKEFRKLRAESDVEGTFYDLRRTFRTVADECKDPVAVDLVMGHSDNSMGATYRQGIADERLIAISTYVYRWLFGQ